MKGIVKYGMTQVDDSFDIDENRLEERTLLTNT